MLAYTNASTIIEEGFQDTEDLNGLFSGCQEKQAVRLLERPLGLREAARAKRSRKP